jgi:hypothetical protein
MSQEYASCPFSLKAIQTVWLSSQPINTFILLPPELTTPALSRPAIKNQAVKTIQSQRVW